MTDARARVPRRTPDATSNLSLTLEAHQAVEEEMQRMMQTGHGPTFIPDVHVHEKDKISSTTAGKNTKSARQPSGGGAKSKKEPLTKYGKDGQPDWVHWHLVRLEKARLKDRFDLGSDSDFGFAWETRYRLWNWVRGTQTWLFASLVEARATIVNALKAKEKDHDDDYYSDEDGEESDGGSDGDAPAPAEGTTSAAPDSPSKGASAGAQEQEQAGSRPTTAQSNDGRVHTHAESHCLDRTKVRTIRID
jgi:hypothetical protein